MLVQADVDGELTPAEAARVAVHVAGCASCAAVQAGLMGLSRRVRADAPYFAAPEGLREVVRARVAAAGPVDVHAAVVGRRGAAVRLWAGRGWWKGLVPFGGGFALAASLALVMVLPQRGDGLDGVVSGHIRALQPGHLMDVVSTDQHTVKPWFDGRLDFAPPVKDLKEAGFPLAGGRLDYVGGRAVAALVYYRRQHTIDLFVWPETGGVEGVGSRQGYHVVRWFSGGMAFVAVSDLEMGELGGFVELWRGR